MVAHSDVAAHIGDFSVHWYVIGAVVLCCVALLLGLSVCVYQCYKRRPDANDPDTRLSAAIRKGFMKEYQSSVVEKTPKYTSTSLTQDPEVTGGRPSAQAKNTQQTFQSRPPADGRDLGTSVTQQKCYTENETEKGIKSPQEKGESSIEKAAECESKGKEEEGSLGSLHFAVSYDGEKSALIVAVNRAKNLPARDQNVSTTDPYVKLQLLPDKRQKVKTRVLRKTRNPVFDEIFTFYGIDDNQLSGITLHFVILSYDRFSRDDIIGEVVHSLADVEFGKLPTPVSKDILPRHIKTYGQGRGELLVSVCHHPAANRLTVVVLKARNLPKMDITGLSDPYVKVYLRYNGQRIAKKKTHVKKRTLNPVFNESFLFDLPVSNEPGNVDTILNNISLELLVLDWDQLTKNEVIGRLEIGKLESGTKFGEQELRHWNEVMNCPRKQIAGWHKLIE